jgi:hypothetical protein
MRVMKVMKAMSVMSVMSVMRVVRVMRVMRVMRDVRAVGHQGHQGHQGCKGYKGYQAERRIHAQTEDKDSETASVLARRTTARADKFTHSSYRTSSAVAGVSKWPPMWVEPSLW